MDDEHLNEEAFAALQQIKRHNWLLPDDTIETKCLSIGELTAENIAGMTPVGSIEFVEWVLQLEYDIQKLRPTIIPNALRTPEFLRRYIATAHSKADVVRFFDAWDCGVIFVKSASSVKCDYADLYTRADELPDDSSYFVSSGINISSEWRVFVHRGSIKDVRNYSGDPWLIPCKDTVTRMISSWAEAPSAYTLDVAVLCDGSTIVMEVHNFVSCGLYGMNSHALIPMLRDGFKFELARNNPTA